MGREVRRVPADWEHPKNDRGDCKPLYDEDFDAAAREWLDNCIRWDNGDDPDKAKYGADYPYYWQWDKGPPDPEYYRPAWPEESRTHIQMYETTSEGTPISPVMETPEELARWLADTGASSFGSQTATYEQWLAMCKAGWASSAVMVVGGPTAGITSGVAAIKEMEQADGTDHQE